MLKLFTPAYYISSYDKLKAEKLLKHNIQLLVCDIDNTLVPHDVAQPDKRAIEFLDHMKNAGIQVVLISNNVEARVATFAKDLDIPYYPFAKKPLSKTYEKMMQDTNMEAKHIAVIGDQLLTDILGGNRVHFYTILTAPVVERDLSFTKINRVFESIIFVLLKKFKKLTKGEFDE